MADSRQTWDQVGKDFSDLGRRVRHHYEQQTGTKQPPAADKRKVDDALQRLADSLDQAFSALGDAIRDPEFGEQTRKTADSLSEALSATFADVSERFKSSSGRRRPPTGT